jgi:hypothetical protein
MNMTASVRRIERWLQLGLRDDDADAEARASATSTFLSPSSGADDGSGRFGGGGGGGDGEERGEDGDGAAAASTAAREARNLQQYFCSDANCDALLRAAFAFGGDDVDDAAGNSGGGSVVYLEPSCGDGRVLKKLAARLRTAPPPTDTAPEEVAPAPAPAPVAIIGVEIDPRMAAASRVALRDALRGPKTGGEGSSSASSPSSVPPMRSHVVCSDFLATSGYSLSRALIHGGDDDEDAPSGDGAGEKEGPCAAAAAAAAADWPPTPAMLRGAADDVSSSSSVTAPARLVVVGGPPYSDYDLDDTRGSSTAKDRGDGRQQASEELSPKEAPEPSASSSSSSRYASSSSSPLFRSLPMRFVLHAARPAPHGLGADKVAFLLPTRCARPDFRRDVLADLARFSGGGHASGGGGWEVRVEDAPEKYFDFKGRRVPVPSVIWTLSRSLSRQAT